MNSMSKAQVSDDDKALLEAGYKPQLHRSLDFFASFAVPYSFMSILMGIFAGYSYVLNKAGPFGLWTWLIVGAGQLLVALVFAEMAGRMPLTGSLYNWNTKLSNPFIAWMVAWLLVFAYAIAAPGIIVAMMPPLQTLLGTSFTQGTTLILGTAIIGIQLLINIYGIRFATYINRAAVILEIVAVVGFGLVLAFLLAIKGGAHPELLTTVPSAPSPYIPAFLMSILLAAYTIFGFESASDLSEETLQVKTVAPKSILYSVLASVGLGFFFIVVLTLAIPNLAMVAAATDSISTIVAYYFGTMPTQIFLICVLVAMFAAVLLNITLASRLLFAVARDKQIAAAHFFEKISSRKVPANASIIIAAVEILTLLIASGFSALYAAPVVLLSLAYLVTVVNFFRAPDVLPPVSTFSLGTWRKPVAALAILWLVAEIAILTIPQEFHLAAYIAAAVLIIGVVLQALFKPRPAAVQ